MQNNYLLRCFFGSLVSVPVFLSAQCPFSVNAGEDVYVCTVPQQIMLNGEIESPYINYLWTTQFGQPLPGYATLTPVVNISQTSSYILNARSFDPADNLIVNEDFEQGNTGFSSDMQYSPGDLLNPGTYDVLTNPQSANPNYYSCGDHTSGSGNMLVANCPAGPNLKAWCQTVAVTPHTEYYYSFWATRALDATPSVGLYLNDKFACAAVIPVQPCMWENAHGIWDSGVKTSVQVCFEKFSPNPGVLAIDDIIFAPVCKATDTVTVNVVNVQAKASPPVSYIDCEGANLTLNGSGSTTGPKITYNWETPDGNIVSGQNTLNPVVNASGTYTLTVSVENGIGDCPKTATVSVGNANQPQVTITSPQPLTCISNAILAGHSSQPAASAYHWTAELGGNIVSGTNNPSVIVDKPGLYTLLVTNSTTGCTAEATFTVDAPPGIPVANAGAGAITCAQPQANLSGAGSSTGPNFAYAWSTSGGNIVSGQDSLYAVAGTPGVYVLLVTNTANKCAATDTVTVKVETGALPVNILPADTITCVRSSVTLTTDSATYRVHNTYKWKTLAGGNIVSGADSLAPVVNAPGLYVLLATDTLNACTGTDTVVVVANADAIIAIANAPETLTCTHKSVALNADGSNPDPALKYMWSTSGGNIVSGADSPTPIVDAPGIYQLLLTNPTNGCTATDLAEVTADLVAPAVELSVSGTINCHNATVDLQNSGTGASGPLDHVWSGPDGSVTNTGANPVLTVNQPGNYSLVVTNTQNGCADTAGLAVVQRDNVAATLTAQQNASCFGAADGALGVTAGGGDGAYTYLWSNGAGTPSLGNLAAGTYSVVVTDGENCTASVEASVAQPDELFAVASATPVSAPGASDGTAAASPQGGTAPYTFLWENGGTTPSITGLPAGSYTVTVADARGCTAVQTVIVSDAGCALLADFQTVSPSCFGAANGQATIFPVNGLAPYVYAWTSGATEQTAAGLAAGTYGVTVTDANGCPFSGTVSLDDPPLLTLVMESVVNTDCPTSAEGSAAVLASGGTGAVGIAWNNGQTGPVATGLAAGMYTAIATDANGCTAATTIVVQPLDLEAPLIQAGATTVPLGMAGAVSLTLQLLGATVTDNCTVAGVQINPKEFDCFDLGEQQVIISAQDESGNSTTETILVTIVDDEAPKLECPPGISRCFADNPVEYDPPVAFDNCLALGGFFNLMSGLPSGSLFPEGTTTNTYTYTDMQGNTGSCSFAVTILSPLLVTLDSVIHDIDNQNIGGIQVTVGGSMPGYSYAWLKNGAAVATTEDLSGAGAGLYTLLVTDVFGCNTEAGPFEVTSVVHTDNPDLTGLIAVFPNPASGLVHVVLPDELLDSDVYLTGFDATGRKVLEQQSSRRKQLTLDLTPVADGLYSILIQSGQGQTLRTIFIVR